MSIPNNITKEHLILAIKKIDEEGIPTGGKSQYYDVIVHGKTYPPKLVVSYANIFANGEELDRTSFRGGLDTPCFNLLTENGFTIQEKPGETITNDAPNIWFVTQGETFSENRGMRYLWAPKEGKDGRSRFYWENVSKVKSGDIIFNYSRGIKGISIATSDGYSAKNAYDDSTWTNEGYRVDIELHNLSQPIPRELIAENINDFNRLLNPVRNKPFNKKGSVNQGYLFEFTKEAGAYLRYLHGKNFGIPKVDNVFNSIVPNVLPVNGSLQIGFLNEIFLDVGLFYDFRLTHRFTASLLSKPFVILTGLTGSGKTKLAQAFAQFISESKDQYEIIAVGADWTNRDPLLGYPDGLDKNRYVMPESGVLQLLMRAKDDLERPYFLILDEMNLSHVERYFADFLSCIESGEPIKLHDNEEIKEVPKEIRIPKNVFVIGTVNIDETTHMFSPKVLDRAHTIEFRVDEKDMVTFFQYAQDIDLKKLEGKGADMAESFVALSKDRSVSMEVNDAIKDILLNFFRALKPLGAEFGYRSANEIRRFIAMLIKLDGSDSNEVKDQYIDYAVIQKLLPKLHGSRKKLKHPLSALAKLCLNDGAAIKDEQILKMAMDYEKEMEDINIKYPLSFEKILRMLRSAETNGYASFAEA